MIQHFLLDQKHRVRFILQFIINLQTPSLSGIRNFNSYFDVQLSVTRPIEQPSHPEDNLKNEYTLLFHTICESIKLNCIVILMYVANYDPIVCPTCK